MAEKKIVIVGGGLAGLIASIHLTRAGVACQVIEKKSYPFHRVCGEYISNEVVPYLRSMEIFPSEYNPADIRRFELTSVNGRLGSLPLDLGGFGISRYQFDYFLYRKAKTQGVEFVENTEIERVDFAEDIFHLQSGDRSFSGDLVIGSFGKRSRLDIQLQRTFIKKRSPYVGVKYHIHLNDLPQDVIALHNFEGGYCGVSHVEGDVVNLCYLSHRDNLRESGGIPEMEERVLFRNPFLRKIFNSAEFLFEKPETINEISFETKDPVVNHILTCGDAAGMIAPLCGNGMAMAIHSAKILSEHILEYCRNPRFTREVLEKKYAAAWKDQFASRLWAGRHIQRLFGEAWKSNLAVSLVRRGKPLAKFLMRRTHGKTF